MKGHLTELAQRREQLQCKAQAQRQQLGVHMGAIDARVRVVDMGFLKVRAFLQRPVVLAGGAALAFWLGPRRALRLVGKSALLISMARRLLGLVR